MRSRFVRRSIAALSALLLALPLAGAALWWQRRELAQWWILRELARRGVAPARVEIARFDLRGLALRGLRAGAGDALAIDAIDADYGPAELWRGRVRALRVSGVRLTGEIGADGARFGGLEALARGSPAEPVAARAEASAPAGLRLPALPSSELRIEAARAEIATAQGPLGIEVSVDARERAGRTRARVDIEAHHALANATALLDLAGAGGALSGGAALGLDLAPGAALELPLSAGRLALSAGLEVAGPEILVSLAPGPVALTFGEGSQALRVEGLTPQARLLTRIDADGELAPFELKTTGGELRAPALDFAARGFELDVRLDPSWRRPAGRFAVLEVMDTRTPPRAPRFALAGSLAARESALGFDLRATETRHHIVLNAQGTWDPESRSGEASLRLPPVRFAKDGLQPAQLAPLLAGRLRAAVGTLEATGRARFSAAGTQLTLDVAGRDLGFEMPAARFTGLNGTLRFTGPRPLATPPGQLVSIARIDFGLELTNGLIAGQLRPDGVVAIESAEWQIAGGRVRTAGRIDPKAARQACVLEADGLDLAQLLALVDLAGLSGEGKLDGRLPIARDGAAIRIDHGVFRARPGARLRYRPAPGAASLRQRGAGFDVLLGAFENLAVEKLEIELDGDANGKLKLALHVAGANPDYQNGRPVHYNLTIESPLADLLRESAAVSKVPRAIEERLERFGRAPP